MECQFPEVNGDSREVEEILKKYSKIAVVGLSPKSEKDSNKVAKYMQEHGYKIYPIYPKESEILGEKVFASLADVDSEIEVVNLFRKAEVMDEVVDIAIKRGDVKVIWSQIGIVNNEAAKRAKEAGLEVIQSKCLMVEHRRFFG